MWFNDEAFCPKADEKAKQAAALLMAAVAGRTIATEETGFGAANWGVEPKIGGGNASTDEALADLVLAKRKKDVEEEEDMDDEEEEEDELDEEEDEDDFDEEEEEEDEFEEEFDDDELDEDDDDIFYDDEDDE